MAKTETIKSKREFERVFLKGARFGDSLVRMRFLSSANGVSGKVAFVAAKRLGNAVTRNRCKRVLREAAREVGLPHQSYDVIMFATNKTKDAHPHEVAKQMGRCMRRAGITLT